MLLFSSNSEGSHSSVSDDEIVFVESSANLSSSKAVNVKNVEQIATMV